MISVFLMGGLGNQLFQIFATIGYSLRHKIPFKFEYSDILKIGVHRPTYWKNFLKSISIFTIKEKLNYPLYKEKYYHYEEIPLIKENFKLYGYFQSYKYFDNEYENIKKYIKLKEQQEKIKEEYKEYNKENSISIHFRLGDYLNIQEHHPIMKLDYYINSLNEIIEEDKKYNVLYFCQEEDNSMVLKNIEILRVKFPLLEFIKVSDKIEDWKQMLIMSNCEYNIIANSSFSWWGAYFNNNQNKKVCYPSIWFGPAAGNRFMGDLCPKEWIKV